MLKFIKNISFLILLITLVSGCKNNEPSKENDEILTEVSEETSEPNNEFPEKMCFKNEFPFKDDPSQKDVQELTLEIKDGKAWGTYSWLPAFKDKREGKVEGVLEGKAITAKYRFMQEGKEDSAQITIVLDGEKAIVSGGAPELGLAANIEKVPCVE